MKPIRITVLAILALSFTVTNVLGSAVAAAPVRIEFQHLRWKNNTIKIAISNSLTRPSSNIKSDSDVLGAIQRSLQAWSAVADLDLQTEFSDRQNVSPNGPAGDGISLITIAQTPENVLFFSSDADTASAKTRIFFNKKGLITEADIVLNPFQQFSTDGTFGTFDLESTLTHEIGHLLGLHHQSVLGATMAESFAKNGTMGFADFGPRTLSQSDIAAIRDLYGPPASDEECCGLISGELSTAAGRPGKDLEIWAEESGTGRVFAQADSAGDGSFRIGGLPKGDYSLYWKTKDAAISSSVGQLADVSVEKGETTIVNEKIAVNPLDIAVRYLGLNSQLADYGISLAHGRSYIVNLGGSNIEAGSLRIFFNSTSIRISPLPAASQWFGEGVSGISFAISIDPDITPGQYSIFASGKNGPSSCLIGALSIE